MNICVSVYACKITLMWKFFIFTCEHGRQYQLSTAKAKPVQLFQTSLFL